jgi:hypothetical protein
VEQQVRVERDLAVGQRRGRGRAGAEHGHVTTCASPPTGSAGGPARAPPSSRRARAAPAGACT